MDKAERDKLINELNEISPRIEIDAQVKARAMEIAKILVADYMGKNKEMDSPPGEAKSTQAR